MLLFAVNLEPLSLFLYTWRFLATLEEETEHKKLKAFYRWLARFSIILLPLGFYAVFSAFIIENGKYLESNLSADIDGA